jgi:stress-induced-phosphoprotein 1
LGKEVKAIKDAEQAIELKPEWVKGYYRKGQALFALRRYEEASEVLKTALDKEPKNKEIASLLRESRRKST